MKLARKYTYAKIPREFSIADAVETQFDVDCGGSVETLAAELHETKRFIAKLTEQLYCVCALNKEAVLELLPGFEEIE